LPEYTGIRSCLHFIAQLFEGGLGAMLVPKKIVYFSGCFANYYDPEIGRSLVGLMKRNGVNVILPSTKCCGMPQMANGNLKGATKNFLFNISLLAQAASPGYDIITTCPSCNMMLRKEGPPFFDTEEARFVSAHAYDACEYLVRLHRSGELNVKFGRLPIRVFYHNPCHLKVQNIQAAVTLMRLIPGVQIAGIGTSCCGMGGSYGMKKQNYERSTKIAQKIWADVNQTRSDTVVTDCGGCGLQIQAGTGIKVSHPVTILNSSQLERR
jgi:glycerol-3-phosphate dehydrogenase subunit C